MPVKSPCILSDVLKLCKLLCAQNVKLEATEANSIRGRTLELARPVFAPRIFQNVLGHKDNRPFGVLMADSKAIHNDYLLKSQEGWNLKCTLTVPDIPPCPRKTEILSRKLAAKGRHFKASSSKLFTESVCANAGAKQSLTKKGPVVWRGCGGT